MRLLSVTMTTESASVSPPWKYCTGLEESCRGARFRCHARDDTGTQAARVARGVAGVCGRRQVRLALTYKKASGLCGGGAVGGCGEAAGGARWWCAVVRGG